METKKMKRPNYVDNKKFHHEIVAYHTKLKEAREKGLDEPRISDYIGECIFKIATNLASKPCFAGYSFREEMISDGIENSILYFKDFDPFRTTPDGKPAGSNPFAYFTQVIYYAFLRRISKEEKHRYTLYKSFQESIINNYDTSLLVDHDEKSVLPAQMYDNINVFMDKFEKKEYDKKEKRKQIKQGMQKFYEEQS
jgi:hypothetical protein